jgi:single-strand DNA-binding protein
MARGFAHVTLVGNLTRDPELRQIPSGTSVCQLGVAVGTRYKDSSGEWADRASFFDVVVWGARGETVARYLTKGSQVIVEGRLEQRSWEAQDGSKRSKIEIIANEVVFGSQRAGGDGGGERPAYTPTRKVEPADNDFKDIDFGDDDDIPF